jgi:excisionase family DNA binding protein
MKSTATMPFLTIREVAALLGVSPARAYAMASMRTFPTVRLSPRRIRVPRAAFETWIANQSARALASVAER